MTSPGVAAAAGVSGEEKRSRREARTAVWVAIVALMGVLATAIFAWVVNSSSDANAEKIAVLQKQVALDQRLKIPAFVRFLGAVDDYQSAVNLQLAQWSTDAASHHSLSAVPNASLTYRPLLDRARSDKVSVDFFTADDARVQKHAGWLIDCLGYSFALLQEAGASPTDRLKAAVTTNDQQTSSLRYAYIAELAGTVGATVSPAPAQQCTSAADLMK